MYIIHDSFCNDRPNRCGQNYSTPNDNGKTYLQGGSGINEQKIQNLLNINVTITNQNSKTDDTSELEIHIDLQTILELDKELRQFSGIRRNIHGGGGCNRFVNIKRNPDSQVDKGRRATHDLKRKPPMGPNIRNRYLVCLTWN